MYERTEGITEASHRPSLWKLLQLTFAHDIYAYVLQGKIHYFFCTGGGDQGDLGHGHQAQEGRRRPRHPHHRQRNGLNLDTLHLHILCIFHIYSTVPRLLYKT